MAKTIGNVLSCSSISFSQFQMHNAILRPSRRDQRITKIFVAVQEFLTSNRRECESVKWVIRKNCMKYETIESQWPSTNTGRSSSIYCPFGYRCITAQWLPLSQYCILASTNRRVFYQIMQIALDIYHKLPNIYSKLNRIDTAPAWQR